MTNRLISGSSLVVHKSMAFLNRSTSTSILKGFTGLTVPFFSEDLFEIVDLLPRSLEADLLLRERGLSFNVDDLSSALRRVGLLPCVGFVSLATGFLDS